MLGRCYATGEGVAKNSIEARAWLQKAADQEFPQAKEMLANVVAGRDPIGGRGCLLLLVLPFIAVSVGWLAYRLIVVP